jgi:uncharacterized protein (DUF1684 family)
MTDYCYIQGIQGIRKARDERLKNSPQSWLALVGLFRLEPGNNTFGTDSSNKIVLPMCDDTCRGSFHLENGAVRLIAQTAANLTVNEVPLEPRNLRTDQDEETDLIRAGSLALMVLLRGDDYYLRVWDKNAPAVMHFTGLKYYLVKPEYRITADFMAYDTHKSIRIRDVIGGEHDGYLAGEAHFTMHGTDCCLVAEDDGDELLFSFTDETRQDTTYPGGRYISSKKPKNGRVILDFNMAVNWPCAYSPYATCPLPPAENRLPVRIEAGEMRFKEH